MLFKLIHYNDYVLKLVPTNQVTTPKEELIAWQSRPMEIVARWLSNNSLSSCILITLYFRFILSELGSFVLLFRQLHQYLNALYKYWIKKRMKGTLTYKRHHCWHGLFKRTSLKAKWHGDEVVQNHLNLIAGTSCQS